MSSSILDLHGTAQLEVEAECPLLSPARVPRQGWEEQFQHMAENADDKLLDSDTLSLTKWDEAEWQW